MPVRQSVQPVVSETSKSNQAILEAIQPLSVQMVSLSSRVDDCLVQVACLVPQRSYLFSSGVVRVAMIMMRREMMMKS